MSVDEMLLLWQDKTRKDITMNEGTTTKQQVTV